MSSAFIAAAPFSLKKEMFSKNRFATCIVLEWCTCTQQIASIALGATHYCVDDPFYKTGPFISQCIRNIVPML